MFSPVDLLWPALAGVLGGWLAGIVVGARQRRRQEARRDVSPETFRVRTAAVEAGPAAGLDAEQVRHAESMRRAQTAIEALQRSVHAYKALADRFERSLGEARAETEQERQRADAYRRHAAALEVMLAECQGVAGKYQAAYAARTVQMLGAGFNLVIDHAGTRRNTKGDEANDQR